MRAALAIAVVLYAAPARAEPPRLPHVLHVPTAWIGARGSASGSAGGDHRGGGFVSVTAALAGVAELDTQVTDTIAYCNPCDGARAVTSASVASTGFKMGITHGGFALALGFRRSFSAKAPSWSAAKPELAQLYLAASADLGPFRVHGGVSVWAAAHHAMDGSELRLAQTPRPFLAAEWTPSTYPKTTVIADGAFVPELGPTSSRLRWIAGWGVRYQALSWGAIELAVRHREGDGLAGATVLVRLDGTIGR